MCLAGGGLESRNPVSLISSYTSWKSVFKDDTIHEREGQSRAVKHCGMERR